MYNSRTFDGKQTGTFFLKIVEYNPHKARSGCSHFIFEIQFMLIYGRHQCFAINLGKIPSILVI